MKETTIEELVKEWKDENHHLAGCKMNTSDWDFGCDCGNDKGEKFLREALSRAYQAALKDAVGVAEELVKFGRCKFGNHHRGDMIHDEECRKADETIYAHIAALQGLMKQ